MKLYPNYSNYRILMLNTVYKILILDKMSLLNIKGWKKLIPNLLNICTLIDIITEFLNDMLLVLLKTLKKILPIYLEKPYPAQNNRKANFQYHNPSSVF